MSSLSTIHFELSHLKSEGVDSQVMLVVQGLQCRRTELIKELVRWRDDDDENSTKVVEEIAIIDELLLNITDQLQKVATDMFWRIRELEDPKEYAQARKYQASREATKLADYKSNYTPSIG